MFCVSHFFPASYPNFPKVSQQGSALLLFTILFLVASLTLVLSIGRGVYDDLVSYRILESGKASFYGAEAGIEDAVHRHRQGKNYSNNESFSINGVTVAVTRTTVVDTHEIFAEGNMNSAIRRSEVNLVIGDGASFNFGMQSGNGGIKLLNTSSVVGNVFSNNTVEGAGNFVYGEVISAGPTGLVDSIHATGSVWAHTIEDSVVEKDAYYQTIVGTSVLGTQNPGSADQVSAVLPISDAKIDEWKNNIITTGTIIASTSPECSSGTYTINTSTTLNNVKIECNVILKKQGGTTNITFAGPVWIEGNLDFTSGPSIIADSSLGSRSVPVIVDNVSNRLTSSKVTVNNATDFTSGNAQSYIVIISMNNSAENGGVVKAIDLGQTTTGKLLVYASHGLIEVGQSTSLKEITAYQIKIINSAQVTYESGLASLLFTTGPGGGYTLTSWREIE